VFSILVIVDEWLLAGPFCSSDERRHLWRRRLDRGEIGRFPVDCYGEW
jgi:hypothetical protein